MTYRLIYKSKASPDVTEADFRTIAMFASLSNKQHNIAGLLLHCDGQIMQVLEGPEEDVKALYGKIEQDKRHVDITVEMSRDCKTAIFQKWSMGYRPVESSKQMDAFFELTRESLKQAIPNSATQELRDIVGDFATSAGII